MCVPFTAMPSGGIATEWSEGWVNVGLLGWNERPGAAVSCTRLWGIWLAAMKFTLVIDGDVGLGATSSRISATDYSGGWSVRKQGVLVFFLSERN